MTVSEQKALCDKLRKEMHEVPMNPVYTDHKGRKSLGNHSMAWASISREWGVQMKILKEMENEMGKD